MNELQLISLKNILETLTKRKKSKYISGVNYAGKLKIYENYLFCYITSMLLSNKRSIKGQVFRRNLLR